MAQEAASESKGPGVRGHQASASLLLPGPQLCDRSRQLPLSGPQAPRPLCTGKEGGRAWGQERGSAVCVGVEGREGEQSLPREVSRRHALWPGSRLFLRVVFSNARMKIPSSGPMRGEGAVLQGFLGTPLGRVGASLPGGLLSKGSAQWAPLPARSVTHGVSGLPPHPLSLTGVPWRTGTTPPTPSHWSLTRYPTEGLLLVLSGPPPLLRTSLRHTGLQVGGPRSSLAPALALTVWGLRSSRLPLD